MVDLFLGTRTFSVLTDGGKTSWIDGTYNNLDLNVMTKQRRQNALALGSIITDSFNRLVTERYDRITTNSDDFAENIDVLNTKVSSVSLVSVIWRDEWVKQSDRGRRFAKKLKFSISVKTTETYEFVYSQKGFELEKLRSRMSRQIKKKFTKRELKIETWVNRIMEIMKAVWLITKITL